MSERALSGEAIASVIPFALSLSKGEQPGKTIPKMRFRSP